MLSHVCGKVLTGLKDQRKAKKLEHKDETVDFEIRSPLLQAKAKKILELESADPFRALLRCVGPSVEAKWV